MASLFQTSCKTLNADILQILSTFQNTLQTSLDDKQKMLQTELFFLATTLSVTWVNITMTRDLPILVSAWLVVASPSKLVNNFMIQKCPL